MEKAHQSALQDLKAARRLLKLQDGPEKENLPPDAERAFSKARGTPQQKAKPAGLRVRNENEAPQSAKRIRRA